MLLASLSRCWLVLPLWLAATASAEDPWADAVVSANTIDPNPGFNAPTRALGAPLGGGMLAPNNSAVHSIGRPDATTGSDIVLRFNTPVTDDPLNPFGLDCIVFGNAFWVGGDPQRRFIEAGLISISEDINHNGIADDPWYVLPGSRGYGAGVLPEGVPNPTPPLAGSVLNPGPGTSEANWGYADCSPTQKPYLDNYLRPDDPLTVGLSPRSGGGDAFDIAWAVDEGGEPAGLTRFHFLRVSAFISGSAGFGFVTPEIDAAADVAPAVDTDGDGILDEYETRVAGTDPLRGESTVLALEIPAEEGGNPAGALLGTARDAAGNAFALYSAGLRDGERDYNASVDIFDVADPAPEAAAGEFTKSGAVRNFVASVPDFAAAQVQAAEFTIRYTPGEIEGLDESALTPFWFDGARYVSSGITVTARDGQANTITFRSTLPGIYLLASVPAQTGDPGELPITAWPAIPVVLAAGTWALRRSRRP